MPGTTTSNFAFVAPSWPLIADLGVQAERLLYRDAHACVFKLRAFEEELIGRMLQAILQVSIPHACESQNWLEMR